MSEVTCVLCQPDDTTAWNEFVSQSNNGTLFHRLDFLAYHQSRFDNHTHHFRFEKKGNCIGVLPLGIFEEEGVRVAKSPFGASFGGLVTRADCSLPDMEQMVDRLVEHLREQQVKRLRVVQPPSIYYDLPEDYFDFCLMKHGAQLTASDMTSYIKVREQPLEGFQARARRDTQKAIDANLTVTESDDVSGFYAILMENMQKFDGTPTHSEEEVAWLVRHLPEQIKIFHVRHDDQAIGSSLVFKANARTWLIFYWAQCQEFTQLHSKNYLIVKISELARQEGVTYIDFGPQTLHMEPFYGVTMFKESLGGRGLFRRAYCLDI